MLLIHSMAGSTDTAIEMNIFYHHEGQGFMLEAHPYSDTDRDHGLIFLAGSLPTPYRERLPERIPGSVLQHLFPGPTYEPGYLPGDEPDDLDYDPTDYLD